MNRAQIHNYAGGFWIQMHDIALSSEVNQSDIAMPKSVITEWLLNKGGLYSNNMPVCTYTLPSGREYQTHAGVVSRGTDSGVTTWFTDDGTEAGTPDTEKLYLWVKDKLLQ